MTGSLLTRDATGGAVARAGFEYQDAFVLQNLPAWLSQGAFSHVVSESKGDVEVCYFSPLAKVRRRTYEAKDYQLTETQFWSELADFKKMHDASHDEFVEFALVCRSFNKNVSPLINMLERLRGVGGSFPSGSPILAATRTEIVDWVGKQGHDAQFAEFIIARVVFLTFSAESADVSFGGMLEKHLPTIDLNGKKVTALRDRCKALVARSSQGPIQRAELEKCIVEVLDADAEAWVKTPTEIRLVQEHQGIEELDLRVAAFTGADRAGRTAVEWEQLLAAAEQISRFVVTSRQRRVIGLDGKQRMSLACLLGYVFSAVKGFTLAIRHNGQTYRTDDHAKAADAFFTGIDTTGSATSKEGVACIGFPMPVGNDMAAVVGSALTSMAQLTLISSAAIADVATLNQAVAEAKEQLVRFRSEHQLNAVRVFLKAPSVFAVALGHRLNGVGPVQLYDWVDGRYVVTVALG